MQRKAKEKYSANKTALANAQAAHASKMKFAASPTRTNGLSADQIGPAPTMQFSSGIQGVFERRLDYEERGVSRMDQAKEEAQRKRGSLGFGGNPRLG